MQQEQYQEKIQLLKKTVENTEHLEFEDSGNADSFGNLGVKLKQSSYQPIQKLAENGVVIHNIFPNQDNTAYFAAVTTEKQQVTKTVEKTQTYHTPPEP